MMKEKFIECCCINSKKKLASDKCDSEDSTDEMREDVEILTNIKTRVNKIMKPQNPLKFKKKG